jgi:type IX secretion system PorP/SprF family membrane protein
MKKILIILIIAANSLYVSAQQDPMFSQYWVNPQVLNPAQAGADGRTLLNATGRLQWVNVKGAPKTSSLAIGGMAGERIGLGLSYVYDQIGVSRTNTVNADINYHLKLKRNWRLITGLRLIGLVNQMNFSEISTTIPGDPLFMENLSSGLKPNAGFGFLLTNKSFYIGYSQPRVVNYDFGAKSAMGNTKIISHRFTYMGYNFDLNDEFKFRPSVLMKEVSNAPVQFDLNAVLEMKSKVVTGLSYRTGDGVGAMLGVVNVGRFDMYYCYDYPLSAISMLSKQTHQITISLNLNGKPSRINSPRYFN